MVKLACFELTRYRRLRAVRLDLQDETTVLVGANDSGKSSLVLAIQKFLAHATGRKGSSEGFSAYDISADGWGHLIELGRIWEQAPAENVAVDAVEVERKQQLSHLLGLMPSLDVWLEARDGAWHLVRDLIPTFEWAGGLVGVRLRLEPVTTTQELDRLIEAYRKARSRVPTVSTEGAGDAPNRRAWPTDLFDYFKKVASWFSTVAAYKLDPDLLTDPKATGEAQPQTLDGKARPFEDASPLRNLMRVDFVAAQRGLGGEEAASGGAASGRHVGGLLSAQLVDYAREMLGRDEVTANELETARHGAVATALEQAHGLLDAAINEVLREPIRRVRELGYPGLGDVRDIVLRTEVQPAHALRHESAVQYRSTGAQAASTHLPEHAIGLGYQNLLSLTFALMRFRDDRLRPGVSAGDKQAPIPLPPIHLVLLEEPEAHLHVQVQRSFIQRAHAKLAPESRPELSTQLLVSTHSSHLAHAVDFAHLRYLRRTPRVGDQPLPTSVVLSLAGVFGSGAAADEDTLRFVQRYLRVQHNDLLFADAVVLVEGAAERVLVPAFIERDHESLQARYLSLLEVGGSHAHRLRPLLERLALPTLVLTDLDPVDTETSMNARGKQHTSHRKRPTTAGPGLLSNNPSLRAWLSITSVEDLLVLPDVDKVRAFPHFGDARLRVAYQIPARDGEPCPSSLEDAFVLESRPWFEALPESVTGTLGKVSETAANATPLAILAAQLHEMMGKKDFDKGAFALDICMRMETPQRGATLACPRYIREGLAWLTDEFNARDATMTTDPA